jgi:hypothetical protein
MNLSRIAFGTFAVVGVSVLGCSVDTSKPGQITFKSQTRYVQAPDVTATATKDWTTEDIEVRNDSLSVLVNGGTIVQGDPSVKKITVTARMVAYADAEDKASADKTLADAVKTLQIDESGGKFVVRCGHGGSYGTSDAGKSGCELMTVRVPAGSATTPVKLTVKSGNGDVKITGITGAVQAEAGSSHADVSVTPTKGAVIVVTGDRATLALPANFAADMVTVAAEHGKVITTDFPTLQSGKGFGNAGEGASSITVTAKGLLDDDNATIKKQ